MNRIKKAILGSVFCLFFSFGPAHGQSLTVTGITTPAAANGTYLQFGDLFGYKAWKHATLEYYIYNDDFGGPRYWNIDTDTLDDNPGTEEDVLFYCESTALLPTGLDYAGSVSSPYTFGEGNPDVQTLSISVSFTDGAGYAPGNATAGTNNNCFGRFRLQASSAGSTLQSATILLSGTRSGVTELKLWSSADDVFNSGDDTRLDNETATAGASVTFAGFSAPIGTGGVYFFVTGDLSPAAGGSLALSIQNNSALSIQDGTLSGSISNAALSSGPVSITSSGPEIFVEGNGVEIADGDTTPAAADHTYFGGVDLASGVTRAFIIRNTGWAQLNLSGVTLDNAVFSITDPPAASVAMGDSTGFTIEFHPAAIGPATATVSIVNDDANENPYTFTIQGTGTSSAGLYLDAGDFASLGSFNPAGDVSIDMTTLQMSGGFSATGVETNGILVFTFDQFNLAAGRSIEFSGVTNSGLKIAFLSKGNMTLAGNIQANALTYQPGPGGHKGGQALAEDGSGPGGGTADPDADDGASGGGFGGNGGAGGYGAPGGSSYGDLAVAFEAGSGGARSEFSTPAGGHGGGGGGALELGALQTLAMQSGANIEAQGAAGFDASGASFDGDGGGSGGGILMHAHTITIASGAVVNANGGTGGDGGPGTGGGGGGGGGGRIRIAFHPNGAAGSSNNGTLSAAGGALGADAGNPGTAGAAGTADWVSDSRVPIAVQEINLIRDGTDIPDGGSIDFGSRITGAYTDFSITIENLGTMDLTLTTPLPVGGLDADQFSIQQQPDALIASGSSTVFILRFAPTSAGAKTATMAIANNDDNENPYNLALTGIGTVPEIQVRGNDVEIADGDTAPSIADYTDFESVNISGVTRVRIFYIHNIGSAGLNLTGNPRVVLTGSADFTVLDQPAASILSNGSSWFSVQFDPGTAGLHTATVTIANDDSDENPYTFAILGSGTNPGNGGGGSGGGGGGGGGCFIATVSFNRHSEAWLLIFCLFPAGVVAARRKRMRAER